MKSLHIALDYGRVWTVTTSDGKRAQGSSMIAALDQLLPPGVTLTETEIEALDFSLGNILASIRDDGRGQIASGQASA